MIGGQSRKSKRGGCWSPLVFLIQIDPKPAGLLANTSTETSSEKVLYFQNVHAEDSEGRASGDLVEVVLD